MSPSLSDFPSSIARVRAGECPLCGGAITMAPDDVQEPTLTTFPDQAQSLREIFSYALCVDCQVGWRIVGVHDPLPEHGQAFGLGPMLVPSRKLTEAEARKLYTRPSRSSDDVPSGEPKEET